MKRKVQNQKGKFKFKCLKCGKIPKRGWYYMPDTQDSIDYFYCDNCVPRGCSCNMELNEGISYNSKEATDPNNYHALLDKKNRELPCCEYFFVKNDFSAKQRVKQTKIKQGRRT